MAYLRYMASSKQWPMGPNLQQALKALEAAKAQAPKPANSQQTPGYLLQNRGF